MITNEVVNRAIAYILNHIGEEIAIEDVAEYCHFSKYYFSRVFKAETGESLYAFIKRVRMEQSAFRLKLERGKSITDIGVDYGFSASNYSTAFRKYYHTSPVDFRKNIFKHSIEHPLFKKKEKELLSYEECCKNISIKTLGDYFVIYERRMGNYEHMKREWNVFIEKYQSYITPETKMIERTFDDPSITNVDNCLYDICMSVDKNCQLENTCTIHGGKFAVYHFKGYVSEIYAVYQNLFNIWFPEAHYEIDERYGFDIYHEIDCETMYADMDICLPVK